MQVSGISCSELNNSSASSEYKNEHVGIEFYFMRTLLLQLCKIGLIGGGFPLPSVILFAKINLQITS